jgi:uncharacterized protein (TIGR02646 family)
VIRIQRPAVAPARLTSHGGPDLIKIFALFDGDPGLYSIGPSTLPVQATIYGHSSVKHVLQRAQHDKCCFCEGIFRGYAAGDVEHFRPKAYSQQEAGGTKFYPGYYWLAYSWENLLFSCQNCNRSHKRNIFPLSNPTKRARKHTVPVTREKPLIVDPAGADDPRDHIRFRDEVPIGITKRGRVTVDVLQLDRLDLNDRRREKLNELIGLSEAVVALSGDPRLRAQAIVKRAQQQLQAARQPEAIFSSMAQDYIASAP